MPALFSPSRDYEKPQIVIGPKAGDEVCLNIRGDWLHATIDQVDARVRELHDEITAGFVKINLADVAEIDTAGIWVIKRLSAALRENGAKVELENSSETANVLFSAVPDKLEILKRKNEQKTEPAHIRFLTFIGQNVVGIYENIYSVMFILGSSIGSSQNRYSRKTGIIPASIVHQIDHMGVRAVPIILLMSFLIGAIIAQQGAFQLRYFGAEIFVVDLVGILQLREIGVLLTAIMIAGRSGSSITAEIGAMKMREEIDALKVIGINPIAVLIYPRLLALCIILPLLTVVANLAALVGAATVTFVYSGITPETFMVRLQQAIDMSTILSGMIKAPFMALVIGVVSSVEGLKVGGSAESLGRRVTSAVVKSIFVVILLDGIFAVFYAAIDF